MIRNMVLGLGWRIKMIARIFFLDVMMPSYADNKFSSAFFISYLGKK
jgi:hypothetical protein